MSSTVPVHLVLVETAGNQAYVFETNKLAEAVGASERIARSTTIGVAGTAGTAGALGDALVSLARERSWSMAGDVRGARVADGDPVEVVVDASGKALLLVRDRDDAQELVYRVTRAALVDAPGLGVVAAVSPEPVVLGSGAIAPAVRSVHERVQALRPSAPSPASRFLRLPGVADCESSGLPAAAHASANREEAPRSHAVWAKLGAKRDAMARLGGGEGFLNHLTELDRLLEASDGERWIAVVHADGNGIGEVMQQLDAGIEGDDAAYLERYRALSAQLDDVTRAAFSEAVDEAWPRDEGVAPVVRLVLGGDDLTVVCEGRRALAFAAAFLRRFEAGTAASEVIREVVAARGGAGGLTACAGVAVTKPHFPFSIGYRLAEGLLRSAKSVKALASGVSALDFHVLVDSVVDDLAHVRGRMVVGAGSGSGGHALWGGPYVVTDGAVEPAVRHWDELMARVGALGGDGRQDPGTLSSAQAHALRDVLRQDRPVAEHQAVVDRRYQDAKASLGDAAARARLAVVEEEGGSLLGRAWGSGGSGLNPERSTSFLDAMALAGLANDAGTATPQGRGGADG